MIQHHLKQMLKRIHKGDGLYAKVYCPGKFVKIYKLNNEVL
jgi:hypothetical protein